MSYGTFHLTVVSSFHCSPRHPCPDGSGCQCLWHPKRSLSARAGSGARSRFAVPRPSTPCRREQGRGPK
eukprot:2482434-Pyramimonas_sp.AAC.1